MIRHLLSFLFFIIAIPCFSQIQGNITDQNGDTLSYATVYAQETYQGTTSNVEGDYSLILEPGTYNIVFQYVGYQQQQHSITIGEDESINLNVSLKEQEVNISEIIISADAEDPAYRIIRNAIKQRGNYLNEVDQFSADLYIKGLVKIGEAPEKFMGIDLGDMEGILDSNRQGIIYLSESKSKVLFEAPDKIKEVMYASKVAGDLEGISFNQYSDVNFSFYNEHIKFNRNLLSPIADNALRFYKYKLESATIDKNGNLINKIKVIPKRENDPIFSGHIYIIEDSWRIHSADLAASGLASKNNMFESIRFKQIYVPVIGEDKWILFSQVMEFKMKLLVFNFNGVFTYFFSDYSLDKLPADTFGSETFRAEANANKRDSIYWEKIRPVPITLEEKNDYKKKDSLEILWNSEEYLDSVDHSNNKFTPLNLLFGYTHQNSFKHRYFSFNSPLNTFQFNAIQGYTLALDLGYESRNKNRTTYFTLNPILTYGFSEKKFRPSINFSKRFNAINYANLYGGIGRKTIQLNEKNPMSELLNTFESLWNKNHYLQIFEKDFAMLGYNQELTNGIRGRFEIEYAHRNPLFVNTHHSIRRKDLKYESNNPLAPADYMNAAIDEHEALVFSTTITIRPKQTYMTFSDFRIRQRSNWPDVIVDYKKSFPVGDRKMKYDYLGIMISDPKVDLNLWGYFSYSLMGGGFLTEENVSFVDYYHFTGNRSSFAISSNYLSSFKLMNNYDYSTKDYFTALFLEYHLEGKIMDNIPLVKNWGLKTVLSYNVADIKDDRYRELAIGIENIGIGGVPLLRVDYVWSFENGDFANHGFFIGLIQDID